MLENIGFVLTLDIMNFEEAKDQIAGEMDMSCLEIWGGILDNTTPGHYGFDELSFSVDPANLWVDFPTKTFKFSKATLYFEPMIGGSSDGVAMKVSRTVSGEGKFEFETSNKLAVLDFDINEDIDLYEE